MAATAEVGVTATLGAAARAVATRQGLLNDPYAEPLLGAVGIDYLTRAIADHTFAADESPVGDDPAVTSLLDALAAHTRFVDEFLAEAGRAGIRQVVILASGLDTRPYRLWWPRGTTVYEIDRPRVLDFKAGVLRGLDARLATNRCAVGIDLRDDWPAALRRVGFDAAQPTAWVAEQLLVGYLKQPAAAPAHRGQRRGQPVGRRPPAHLGSAAAGGRAGLRGGLAAPRPGHRPGQPHPPGRIPLRP